MNIRSHPVNRLHRLGRRLSLINMGISGAILLIIASIALGIADHTIAQQGARDLGLYVRAVHTVLSSDILADSIEGVLRLPERYQVYYHGEESGDADSGAWQAIVGSSVSVDEVPQILDDEMIHSANYSRPDNRYAQALVDGVDYRVSVSQVSPNARQIQSQTPAQVQGSGTLLVLQNLNDETNMRVRMRWLFIGLTFGGMALIVLASLLVSRQSIRPIEDSIKAQRQFVAAASHELRTPVTALNANAEVLSDANLGEYEPYLDSIRSVSERMTRLIQDLIDLARVDAGELPIAMEPVDAREAVTDALKWMQPLSEKLLIKVNVELTCVYLLGDAGRVRQVLLALMDNALRYTKPGGMITVSLKREGKYVRLSVADTGMGIPDESKPRIFDRFYRTDEARDREHGGAGLGLSVVKQLTEGMRGSVAVHDNPGGGTQFVLRFRLAE